MASRKELNSRQFFGTNIPGCCELPSQARLSSRRGRMHCKIIALVRGIEALLVYAP